MKCGMETKLDGSNSYAASLVKIFERTPKVFCTDLPRFIHDRG